MMRKWKISSIIDDQTLMAKCQDEMMKEMAHFKLLKAKKSSKLQRSTALSESIGENYRMMKCLQDVTKDSEYHIIEIYHCFNFLFLQLRMLRKGYLKFVKI